MATKTATQTAVKEKVTVGKTKGVTRANEVREKIAELNSGIEADFLDLASLLSEAYHKEFYLEWGFSSFEEYCTKELDTKYRKAMYFVEIWDKVKVLDLPSKKVKAIGWTKMKDLVSVASEENVDDLVEKAEKQSSREFTEVVKQLRTPGESRVKITTMTFKMGETEAVVIADALAEAKKMVGMDNATLALEMICQEWLEMKGVSPERAKLVDMVAYIEKVYPVKITVEEVDEEEKLEDNKKVESKKEPKAKKKDEKKKEEDKDDLDDDDFEDEVLDEDDMDEEDDDLDEEDDDLDEEDDDLDEDEEEPTKGKPKTEPPKAKKTKTKAGKEKAVDDDEIDINKALGL